jgi:meso-butanediol dehydrogenase/(S,S)-butanediol dehydrogenase/diacetyl reductase
MEILNQADLAVPHPATQGGRQRGERKVLRAAFAVQVAVAEAGGPDPLLLKACDQLFAVGDRMPGIDPGRHRHNVFTLAHPSTSESPSEPTNLTALITGGGTGIGAAVTRLLRAEGWNVCIVGRREEPLRRLSEETGASFLSADVGTEEGADAAVRAIARDTDRLDAVVHCAGTGAGGTVAAQTLERWTEVMRTNVTGAFLVSRAAIPHLERSRGAMVTVSSLAGIRAAPASAAYCTSKAALVMLTRCIAVDHGPAGVRANCVCPGWVRSDLADKAMDELADLEGTNREGAYDRVARDAPLQRIGEPEEVAGAVSWLLGPAAAYVSGAVITVDGATSVVDPGTLAFRGRP